MGERPLVAVQIGISLLNFLYVLSMALTRMGYSLLSNHGSKESGNQRSFHDEELDKVVW